MRHIVAALLLALPGPVHATGQGVPVHKEVRPARRPPTSTLPKAATRQSTALSAAAGLNKPQLQQLPGFSVADRDGRATDAQSLARAAHWLLLYRRPVCLPCDKLMASLAQTEDTVFHHGAAVTVIVAGATTDALARTEAQFPQWSGATWFADPQGDAFHALKLTGAPVLFAMHGSSIAFRIAGNPGNAATVQALAASWLSGPSGDKAAEISAASSKGDAAASKTNP